MMTILIKCPVELTSLTPVYEHFSPLNTTNLTQLTPLETNDCMKALSNYKKRKKKKKNWLKFKIRGYSSPPAFH